MARRLIPNTENKTFVEWSLCLVNLDSVEQHFGIVGQIAIVSRSNRRKETHSSSPFFVSNPNVLFPPRKSFGARLFTASACSYSNPSVYLLRGFVLDAFCWTWWTASPNKEKIYWERERDRKRECEIRIWATARGPSVKSLIFVMRWVIKADNNLLSYSANSLHFSRRLVINVFFSHACINCKLCGTAFTAPAKRARGGDNGGINFENHENCHDLRTA